VIFKSDWTVNGVIQYSALESGHAALVSKLLPCQAQAGADVAA
jgi:hypothetical protein